MTNEQIKAKELAELLNAFAEGKQLQIEVDGYRWKDYFPNLDTLKVKIYNDEILRIKPETKRIALTQQDLIERRKLGFEAMWVKSKLDFDYEFIIEQIRPDGCMIHSAMFAYEDLVDYFVFLDGTPFYKEVGCD